MTVCVPGSLQAIPSSLQQLQKVKILNFSQNNITSVPSGILTGCQALHTLLLHSNPISAQVWHDVSFSVTCNYFSTMSLPSLMLFLDSVLSAFVSADYAPALPRISCAIHWLQASLSCFHCICNDTRRCLGALILFMLHAVHTCEQLQHACVPPCCPLFWHCCSLICAHAVF